MVQGKREQPQQREHPAQDNTPQILRAGLSKLDPVILILPLFFLGLNPQTTRLERPDGLRTRQPKQ